MVGQKQGFIDKTGKEVIPFKYKANLEFRAYKPKVIDGLVRMSLENSSIYIGKNGTEYYEP